MYVPRNPGLAPRALFIPPAGKGATLDCSGLLLFSKARMGIRYALTALGIGPGEAVLAPAYLTGSALAPFDWAGVRCALYDVERTTLAPDWGSVARAQARAKRARSCSSTTSGFRAMACSRLCKAHDLALIEDCARAAPPQEKWAPALWAMPRSSP